jgi:tetratricopeptide (TPR) repeat protein
VIHDPGLWDHDPRLAIAHLNLGLAYKEQGNAKLAIEEFHSAIGIRPELGTAHLKLGDVLKQMGEAKAAECEYLEAIAKFHQDVASDPLSAVAHQRLGDALNNHKEAANCASYDKSVLTHLHDRLNHRHDKRVREHLVDYDGAMAEYQRAAERDPYDAHFHYDLAGEWLKGGEVDKSIDELREALGSRAVSDDSFDEFKYLLLKKLSQALYIKARKDKDKEIGDNVKATLEALEAEGLFYQAVDANEALIERIERRVRVDKKANDNAAAYRRRGADLYLMGKFAEAVAAHKIALAIDKTYLADNMDRGYARLASGNERPAEEFDRAADDFDDAADDFNHAVEFSPTPAETMIWLYLSREHSRVVLRNKYYRQKDHKDELKSNASKLIGSNHEDWRVKLFLDNELPKDILKPEDVLTNVEGNDDQCKTYFYIGEWHALGGKREGAVKWLEKAEEVCPFDLIERSASTAELTRLKNASEKVATTGP